MLNNLCASKYVRLVFIPLLIVFYQHGYSASRINYSAQDRRASWEISGVIAAKNKKQHWTATVNWLQRGRDNYQIRLLGPIGGGAVLIERRGAKVVLKDGAKVMTSNSAEELLQRQGGVKLPVNNLYYWVRALAAPGAVKAVQQHHNLTQRIEQDGFTIDYLAYNKKGAGALPTHIKLHGHGITINFVIKHWQML